MHYRIVYLSEVSLDELWIELDRLLTVLEREIERHELGVAGGAVAVNLEVGWVSPALHTKVTLESLVLQED